jgi:DNA-directed RNA polymerase subunit K/omega
LVHRPTGTHAFEFVVVSMLRAAQLMNGCVPRVADAADKPVTTAQREVAEGKVKANPRDTI